MVIKRPYTLWTIGHAYDGIVGFGGCYKNLPDAVIHVGNVQWEIEEHVDSGEMS